MSKDYSPTGKTTVALEVLHTIARLTTLAVPGVSRMCQSPGVNILIKRKRPLEGVLIDIQDDVVNVDLFVVLKHDVNIHTAGRQVQVEVARAISEMVGMQVGRINVHVEDIDYPGNDQS